MMEATENGTTRGSEDETEKDLPARNLVSRFPEREGLIRNTYTQTKTKTRER